MTASANGTTISQYYPGSRYFPNVGTLIDAAGTNWSISQSQVTRNGVADPTTSHVMVMGYENGDIWQENTNTDWWYHVDRGYPWVQGTNPTLAGLPESPNNTIIENPHQAITDKQGHSWSVLLGQVTKDGKIDPTTSNVTQIAYENGHVWQQNTAGYWYQSSNSGYPWLPGTRTSPVPGGHDYDFVRFNTTDGLSYPLKIDNAHTIEGYSNVDTRYAKNDNGTITQLPWPYPLPAADKPAPDAERYWAEAVSPDGNMIAGVYQTADDVANPNSHNVGFVENKATGAITTADVGGWTYLNSVNDHGVAIGGTDAPSHSGPLVLNQGHHENLAIDGATLIYPIGINDANVILGGFSDGLRNHGFLFDLNTHQATQLDIPGEANFYPAAIDNWGDVLGSFQEPNTLNQQYVIAEPSRAGVANYSPLGEHFGHSVASALTGHETGF